MLKYTRAPASGLPLRVDRLANRVTFKRQLDALQAFADKQEVQLRAWCLLRVCGRDWWGVAGLVARGRPQQRLPVSMPPSAGSFARVPAYRSVPRPRTRPSARPLRPNSAASDTLLFVQGRIDPLMWTSGGVLFAARAREAVEKLHQFNDSQRLAIQNGLSQRLTLVQGPPGTGKTLVGVHLISVSAVRRRRGWDPGWGDRRPAPSCRVLSASCWRRLWRCAQQWRTNGLRPILACSDSNIAVDNLVDGLNRKGVRVVRIGKPEGVRPALLALSIDYACGILAVWRACTHARRWPLVCVWRDAFVVRSLGWLCCARSCRAILCDRQCQRRRG